MPCELYDKINSNIYAVQYCQESQPPYNTHNTLAGHNDKTTIMLHFRSKSVKIPAYPMVTLTYVHPILLPMLF